VCAAVQHSSRLQRPDRAPFRGFRSGRSALLSSKINDVALWYKEWGSLWPDNTVLLESTIYNEGVKRFLKEKFADYVQKTAIEYNNPVKTKFVHIREK
jgi:hypothetical protein